MYVYTCSAAYKILAMQLNFTFFKCHCLHTRWNSNKLYQTDKLFCDKQHITHAIQVWINFTKTKQSIYAHLNAPNTIPQFFCSCLLIYFTIYKCSSECRELFSEISWNGGAARCGLVTNHDVPLCPTLTTNTLPYLNFLENKKGAQSSITHDVITNMCTLS